LDAQNAGNDISGIQISKNLVYWRGILATHVAFSHCYPPLIYYLTERSLFKKCPPPLTGKKALQTDANTHTLFCSILMQLRDYRLVHIVGMLTFDVTRHAELFN
jgi:hypothetical protein